MSSACQSAIGCMDAHVPVHQAYGNLQRWAESDAEFVRSLAEGGGTAVGNDGQRSLSSPVVVDGYSCRQKFLRSYTFSKRETVPEKTVKCLGRVKERATDLPCIYQKIEDSGEISRVFSTLRSRNDYMMHKSRNKKRNKKKNWRSMLWSILVRLLSCTASFDVADGAVVHAL